MTPNTQFYVKQLWIVLIEGVFLYIYTLVAMVKIILWILSFKGIKDNVRQ